MRCASVMSFSSANPITMTYNSLTWTSHDVYYDSSLETVYIEGRELVSEEEHKNSTSIYAAIKKSTLTELADIARTKSGTTDTKTIEEMKTIFAG